VYIINNELICFGSLNEFLKLLVSFAIAKIDTLMDQILMGIQCFDITSTNMDSSEKG